MSCRTLQGKYAEKLEQRIDKAILEIECEMELYDGSNEDIICPSWIEMETKNYLKKLQNFIDILKGKDDRE